MFRSLVNQGSPIVSAVWLRTVVRRQSRQKQMGRVPVSNAAKPRTGFSPPTEEELAWLIPSDAGLPDGRAVDGALLAGMIAQGWGVPGGTVCVCLHPIACAQIAGAPLSPCSL